jgi:hypothetical protein
VTPDDPTIPSRTRRAWHQSLGIPCRTSPWEWPAGWRWKRRPWRMLQHIVNGAGKLANVAVWISNRRTTGQ